MFRPAKNNRRFVMRRCLSWIALLDLGCGDPVGCQHIADPGRNVSSTPDSGEPHLEAWGQSAFGLQSSLTAEKQVFRHGEPILLRYRIRNVSQTDQNVWHAGFWPNHKISVKDGNGKDVPHTPRGEDVLSAFRPDGSRRKNFAVTLSPGAIDATFAVMDLSEYFDVSEIQELHVRCLYHEGPVQVWSNTLILRLE